MTSVIDFGCCQPAPTADALAVSLANTACPEAGTALDGSFREVLDELRALGAIDAATAKRLLKFENRSSAKEAVKRLKSFRDTIVAALDAMRQGHTVPPKPILQLNRELASCGCRREVVGDSRSFTTRIAYDIQEPDDLVMPFANSFADILTSVDFSRVKQCRDPRCTCYFVDTSKNRTRTWCSMDRCGNRNKVAKYYERTRNSNSAS